MTNHLFVYGTLRRISSHPMARFLAERARFVGEATMPGKLYNLGRYPGMIPPAGAADLVVGDLYELTDATTTLSALDAYEGAESPLPAYFERDLAEVTCRDGSKTQAMMYWLRGPVTPAQHIPSGDYRAILEKT